MSLLKVSQLTLIDLGVYSWGSLGCGINDVPFLNDLMVKEGKVCGSLFDRIFFFFFCVSLDCDPSLFHCLCSLG